MWLIMAHSEDYSARWLTDGLRRRGLKPLLWVSDRTLGQADVWEHRIGDGQVFTRIRFTDGSVVDSRSVRGTINRIQQVPADHTRRMASSDRLYTFQEMSAFYLSWLAGLNGPVLNPACPNGLGGRLYHSLELFTMAQAAGLTVPNITLDSRHSGREGWQSLELVEKHLLASPRVSLIVAKDRLIADLRQPNHPSAEVARGCMALSERLDLPLLELQFSIPPRGDWVLIAANPYPDLTAGGQPLIDALASVLGEQTEGDEAHDSFDWNSHGTPA